MWQERARNLEEETKHLRAQLALPTTQPEPVPVEELRVKVDELTQHRSIGGSVGAEGRNAFE